MDEFTVVLALAATASQLTTLAKYTSAGEVRQALTTMVPWLAAFLTLLLGAQADAVASWVPPGLDTALGDLDVASLAFLAVTVGATGGFAYKALTALDRTDSAREPQLGGGYPAVEPEAPRV